MQAILPDHEKEAAMDIFNLALKARQVIFQKKGELGKFEYIFYQCCFSLLLLEAIEKPFSLLFAIIFKSVKE